jgi:D-alanine-D-alanine ligase
MNICVLQPDYRESTCDYQNYDPPRDLSLLLPQASIDHIFLRKATTYRTLRALKKRGYDIFVNLCEGYLDWDIPSVDVIHSLEQLNLPFTGPTSRLYTLHSKSLMKYVAYTEGVATPKYLTIDRMDHLQGILDKMSFPLFVKPEGYGDSLGIDDRSLVNSPRALRRKVSEIIRDYDEAMIEEYIPGREFTVLVVGNPDNHRKPIIYRPLEFIFGKGPKYKTYDLKVKKHSPNNNVPCSDPLLDRRLRSAARKIFLSYGGIGYARLDFRISHEGRLNFLEINFSCSVFYPEGYEGSADYILKYDRTGQSGFLRRIIREGISRHRQGRKKFTRRPRDAGGYGIYAVSDIEKGEILFQGEGRSQRLVTRSHVFRNWTQKEQKVFRRYAYPVSDQVFLLWDDDPAEWAPQNHSCDPNTAFVGLDLVSLRSIRSGEELTIDYVTIGNEDMEPFICRCLSPNCRGRVEGTTANSLTRWEKNKKRGKADA